MPTVKIEGLEIQFPFEPYDVQKEYMKKVITCLKTGTNGILESPTGTGKTLCLLCASGAWLSLKKAQMQAANLKMDDDNASIVGGLQHQLEDVVGQTETGGGWTINAPKIIYTSRTHSQLTQAIDQLTKTGYKYLKTTVLGSRQQLCIHPEVQAEPNSSTKISLCRAKVKSGTCHFHSKVEKVEGEVRNKKENWLMDIEDLVALGRKERFCPYYMAREMKKSADIIFMPYNYILDPKTRKAQNLDLTGAVIIMDEAHNIESVCENTASAQLRSQDIAACIAEVTEVMKAANDRENAPFLADGSSSSEFGFERSVTELAFLKALFCELEAAIEKIDIPANGLVKDGSFAFDLLQQIEVTSEKLPLILELIECIVEFLNARPVSGPFQRRGHGLQKFQDFLEIIFNKDVHPSQQRNSASTFYKVHISIEDNKSSTGKIDVWTTSSNSKIKQKIINYWCFAPGFSMKALSDLQTRSIIVTSGTLHPIDTVANELQIPFPVRLENPHVIGNHQVWAGVITKGPDGHKLNSSFANRNSGLYNSLGRTILHFARLVPDGVLVFFTSYSIMRACREQWEESGVWESLGKQKLLFLEPNTSDEFNSTIEQYYRTINDESSKGAILLAVFRGKVSEGMDFIDTNGRAVIITGLPYAQLMDPRIKLKKEYLDERKKTNQGMSGAEWYSLEATRAINQAVGRVIRHKDDYGALVFCDERFTSNGIQQQLSKWVRPHMKTYNDFGAVVKGVKQFFRVAEQTLPQPAGSKKVKVKIQFESNSLESSVHLLSGTDPEKPLASIFHLGRNKPNYSQKNEFNGKHALDDEVLKASYSSVPFPSSSSGYNVRASTGCLDALENSPSSSSKCIDIMQRVDARSLDLHTKNSYTEQVAVKKRKIVIRPRQNSDLAQSEDKIKRELEIRRYIASAKTKLSQDDYNLFASTVKSYFVDQANFDQVAEAVMRIFSRSAACYSLLHDFQTILNNSIHKAVFIKKLKDFEVAKQQS